MVIDEKNKYFIHNGSKMYFKTAIQRQIQKGELSLEDAKKQFLENLTDEAKAQKKQKKDQYSNTIRNDANKNDYLPPTASKKLQDLTKAINELKVQLYGQGRDPTFAEAWKEVKGDNAKLMKVDEEISKLFPTHAIKQMKTLVLQKLLRKTFSHDEFLEYQYANSKVKKEMLMTLLSDNPFLAGLVAKAAPWVAGKVYDYFKPKVVEWGKNLANKGISKLRNSEVGRALADSQPFKEVRQAYNLDPEELENPMPQLDSRFNGPTSGLLTKPISRVITSSDVNIDSLQAALWPENEAYRFSLPNDNCFTAVLQASTYLQVPVTNNLGNCFLTITPVNIAFAQFYSSYAAAGATLNAIGVGTTYAGPLNANLGNFASMRVTGLSVSIMNMVAPLNRSGTISLAVTNKTRQQGQAITFSLMNMSMIFAQSSYDSSNYFVTYVPDEIDEWQLQISSVVPTSVNSDILIAFEGLPVGITPGKVLISYNIEFEPSDTARPLVNVGRAPVAPSTLSALQLTVKHYNSILLASVNQRGNFFRALKSTYGDHISIDDYSTELANLFTSLSDSRPSLHTTTLTQLANVMGGPSIGGGGSNVVHALRSAPHRVERPVTPEQVASSSTSLFPSVVSQIILAANTAQLNVFSSDTSVTISDEHSTWVLEYRTVNGTYPAFELKLTSDWTGILLGYFKGLFKLNETVVVEEEINDSSNYILEFTPNMSDPVFIRCYSNLRVTKPKPLSIDVPKRKN